MEEKTWREKYASQNKWQAEHMATFSCKIRKEYAEQFRNIATAKGATPSSLIREFIIDSVANKR